MLKTPSFELKKSSFELKNSSFELKISSFELKCSSYELKTTGNQGILDSGNLISDPVSRHFGSKS